MVVRNIWLSNNKSNTMKRRVYISPEVVINDIYTVSNLALDVVIKNSTVEEPLTKERNDSHTDKKYEDSDWGNIW